MLLIITIAILSAEALAFHNGVNLQPSYYNNGNVTFGWDLMQQSNQIKSVRIEIEPDKVEQGTDWIAQASSYGYEIIATYHKCTVLGSDDPQELNEAANWWVENYESLKKGGDFTINVMNEWGSHAQTASSYSDAYNSAVATIRTVYPSNLQIIADVPGWGQETRTAAEASSQLKDPNIVFSAHVYPGSWNTDHFLQASDLDELADTGRVCIIGEFGTSGSGGADVSSIVKHAKSLGFAVLAWAWNGDGGEMNMVTPSWSSNPTSSSYKTSSYFNSVIGLL
jgi:mannan endo-1,4-beta-mannosidase